MHCIPRRDRVRAATGPAMPPPMMMQDLDILCGGALKVGFSRKVEFFDCSGLGKWWPR